MVTTLSHLTAELLQPRRNILIPNPSPLHEYHGSPSLGITGLLGSVCFCIEVSRGGVPGLVPGEERPWRGGIPREKSPAMYPPPKIPPFDPTQQLHRVPTDSPACWEPGFQAWAQIELDMEQQTGSKSGNEYIKAIYCHPAYLTSMQSTS